MIDYLFKKQSLNIKKQLFYGENEIVFQELVNGRVMTFSLQLTHCEAEAKQAYNQPNLPGYTKKSLTTVSKDLSQVRYVV